MTDVFRKFVNNQICGCYDAHVQNARKKLIGMVTARAGSLCIQTVKLYAV